MGNNVDYTERKKELALELTTEVELWAEQVGALPGQIMAFDLFMIDDYLNSLAAFLVEKGIINEDEFTVYTMERRLKKMQELRPQARKAKLESLQQSLAVPAMHIPKNDRRH